MGVGNFTIRILRAMPLLPLQQTLLESIQAPCNVMPISPIRGTGWNGEIPLEGNPVDLTECQDDPGAILPLQRGQASELLDHFGLIQSNTRVHPELERGELSPGSFQTMDLDAVQSPPYF